MLDGDDSATPMAAASKEYAGAHERDRLLLYIGNFSNVSPKDARIICFGRYDIHVSETGQDNNARVSEAADGQDDVVLNKDVDRNRHLANGTEQTTLPEADKQYWVDREASFREEINQLQTEKDAHLQKEAVFEEKIQQLLKEKDENLQKEANREEKIKQLQNEKKSCIQNEASLKEKILLLEMEKDELIHEEDSLGEKIKQLQNDKDAYLQKEAGLEMKILQQENEKDSWLKKEAGFEEKINQLVDEVALLNLERARLKEKIKQVDRERDFWVEKETSTKETISIVNNDNTKLRAQVIDLEESRKSLSQENQLLTENISSLKLHINKLENNAAVLCPSAELKVASENGDTSNEIEAALLLVEKLVTENAELVEKVHELYAELDPRGVKMEASSSVGSDAEGITAQSAHDAEKSALDSDIVIEAASRRGTVQSADLMSEAGKMMSVSGESTQSLEDILFKDDRNGKHVNDEDGIVRGYSSETLESDEIVQIPLDENAVQDTDLQPVQTDDKTDVPLTDAPLIGAPFRLISFFARYVSGADLVEQNNWNLGR
ncbi:Mitochondrial ATP synthase D chain-related protein [Forsythia ovata]|uniref:Mitochondrial ATP synthase D chain-related protein n=1 Tax=Forsythia ovata TaxID=205694 RepID=A0ABD1SIL7_9LAMI